MRIDDGRLDYFVDWWNMYCSLNVRYKGRMSTGRLGRRKKI